MLSHIGVAVVSASLGFVVGGAMAGAKVQDLDARLAANEQTLDTLIAALAGVRPLLEGKATSNSSAHALNQLDIALASAKRA